MFLNIEKVLVNALPYCFMTPLTNYGFRSSRSTADLLTVVSDRIARYFKRSGDTRAVALHTFKAFNRVWHADLLHKRKSYRISDQISYLI